MRKFLAMIFLFPAFLCAQSSIETAIKGGELLLSGLTILKVSKSETKAKSKIIESICVKNKFADKITFRILGKDEEGEDIKKELVIPKEGKECLFGLSKGIYTYEIVLANNEIYKKGEYKFEEDLVITVKDK